ncbi:sugar phosphate isomerase/epimerase [Paenibacillus shirakamiensis]|uniref:Sugar phosphate isomerase/epimerase n=1 Tax=Paenibacillus shirakamiensis TaxID=1265935 RepID=A0ABS4JI84_9BACL|nr:sugar phosphate isomerase/epimerase family protein [Paenibacillus shirakamiensis]MBP2000264.1 sugar phosphate isomerase/epimerase [Paenibacillus shirakamiensis]
MSRSSGWIVSGLSDEAGADLDVQIRAHEELGWNEIEIRSVYGQAMADWDHARFEDVRNRLEQASLHVTAIASRIANWERPITHPFEKDLEELRILADRMNKLGAKYVRIMSYPNDGLPDMEWRQRVLDRMHQLTELAEAANITLLHENCSGWAGSHPGHALELVEQVNSPHFRLLFDTGNGIAYGYDTFEYLKKVWRYVSHVHIKDGIRKTGFEEYTLPGEGDSRVRDCLIWLSDHNYSGIISIEPHLHLIPHLHQSSGSEEAKEAYVAYGQKMERLLREIYVETT